MIGGGKYVNPNTVDTKHAADHSLPYLAAVALLDGEVWPEQFEARRIRARDVQSLMRKVRSRKSARFTREYSEWLSARIMIERVNETPILTEKNDYEGFFRTPMSWGQVIGKYMRRRKGIASETELARIFDVVRSLEDRPVSELTSRAREPRDRAAERSAGACVTYGDLYRDGTVLTTAKLVRR